MLECKESSKDRTAKCQYSTVSYQTLYTGHDRQQMITMCLPGLASIALLLLSIPVWSTELLSSIWTEMKLLQSLIHYQVKANCTLSDYRLLTFLISSMDKVTGACPIIMWFTKPRRCYSFFSIAKEANNFHRQIFAIHHVRSPERLCLRELYLSMGFLMCVAKFTLWLVSHRAARDFL